MRKYAPSTIQMNILLVPQCIAAVLQVQHLLFMLSGIPCALESNTYFCQLHNILNRSVHVTCHIQNSKTLPVPWIPSFLNHPKPFVFHIFLIVITSALVEACYQVCWTPAWSLWLCHEGANTFVIDVFYFMTLPGLATCLHHCRRLRVRHYHRCHHCHLTPQLLSVVFFMVTVLDSHKKHVGMIMNHDLIHLWDGLMNVLEQLPFPESIHMLCPN